MASYGPILQLFLHFYQVLGLAGPCLINTVPHLPIFSSLGRVLSAVMSYLIFSLSACKYRPLVSQILLKFVFWCFPNPQKGSPPHPIVGRKVKFWA